MKKLTLLLIILLLIIFSTGCSSNSEDVEVEDPKPVKILELKNEIYPVTLDYLGNVTAKETKNYSFKLPGKIADIFFIEGQEIFPGDLLAMLDTKDIALSVEASHNTLQKAQSSFDFTQDAYIRMKALWEAEALSLQDLEQTEMKLDLAEADLHNARVDYENKLNMLGDCQIISDMEGYIVQVLYEESEMTSAGYPVIIVRSKEEIVQAGFSLEDVEKIELGMPVEVTVNERKAPGQITAIPQVPDPQTRTFAVEITLEDDIFPLGAFASISLEIAQEEGILIPISSIMSTGEDYVYLVDSNNHIEKRPVQLGKIRGNKVIVSGLSPRGKLVIAGMKKIKHGDSVKIMTN